MKNKNTFSLYLDYWDWFKLLTDEELGRLLRAIFRYEREEIEPSPDDEKISIFFHMVKEGLNRDRKSYEALCNKNRENARLRWQKEKDKPS